MTDFLLDVKNLTINFCSESGITHAVKEVSFRLKEGETLGIAGESGSGKSVSSLAIMQLLPQPPAEIESGEILFNTGSEVVNLLNCKEKQMRKIRGHKISMIFQEPMTSLNPVMRCGKQVAEVLLQHLPINSREAKERTLSLFDEVMLPKPERIYKAYPFELSGGQKQRIMIAMAIACRPALLIADEPTTALDVTVQKTILDLLQRLREKYNMAMIFVSHDLGVVKKISDEVLVMYKGAVVEHGNIHQIFTNPQHPYTKGLIACKSSLDQRLSKLPVVSDFIQNDEQGKICDTGFSTENELPNLLVKPEERFAFHLKIYSQPPVLEIIGLKNYFPLAKKYPWGKKSYLKAVDEVSFGVYAGETLGLVGESGCGKTTLGRTLLRLTEPTEGKVLYKGIDVTTLKSRELRKLRKKIQIIFQDPYSSLNPRMCVGPAIMEPMKVHNIGKNTAERRARTEQLLERVGLDVSAFYKYPHEFSGGQRQRICIARTIAVEPEFIICDESVSALDVSVQAMVLNMLNELKHDFGFTFIFISHDLSVVRFMSDRIVVMKEGKVLELDEADHLYKNPKSDYTRELINAIPGV